MNENYFKRKLVVLRKIYAKIVKAVKRFTMNCIFATIIFFALSWLWLCVFIIGALGVKVFRWIVGI